MELKREHWDIAVPANAPWLGEATRILGSGGRLADYTDNLTTKFCELVDRYTVFNLPWCGAFVRHCLETTLPSQDFPKRYPRARPWLTYGREVEPQVGAIMILWIGLPDGAFGHAGFYWGEDDDCYHVLGGNQYDQIMIERFPKDRLLSARWPALAAEPSGQTRRAPVYAAAPFEYGGLAELTFTLAAYILPKRPRPAAAATPGPSLPALARLPALLRRRPAMAPRPARAARR